MIKVAQCWDDGVLNDIKVVELCRKYEAKATFNLNPALHLEKKRITGGWCFKEKYHPGKLAWNEVPRVYEGFDVASHTMSHCNAIEVNERIFLAEAVSAKCILEDLFQRECTGFAWPFGRYTQATADLLLASGFTYGRTTEYTDRVSGYEHPMILHSSCHFMDPDFFRKFEAAKAGDGIFYFWGHSYEMMDDPQLWADYEAKLRALHNDPEVQWISTAELVK